MRASLADHRSSRGSRTLRFEAFAVALAVFVAYAVSRPDPIATLGRLYDDSVYLSIGKSIADGEGYRSAQLVGTPVHVKFPPLLPATYAVFWRVFGTLDDVAASALWLNIIIAAASAGLLWWIARRELEASPVVVLLMCITPLLSARTMFYFSGPMGEPWMLLGWASALILVRQLESRGDGPVGERSAERRRWRPTAVGLGLVLAATVLARTQGIAVAAGVIAGAVVIAAVGKVAWRAVALSVVTMLAPLAVWSVWHGAMVRRGPVSTLPDQVSYLSWLPTGGLGDLLEFGARVAQMTAREYVRAAPVILLGWDSPKTMIVAGMFVLVGLVGAVMLARRLPALTASILAIAAVLTIWPYAEDRFLTPLVPMLGLAGAYAVQRVLDNVPVLVRRGAVAGMGGLAVLLLANSARTRVDALRGEATSPFVMAFSRITGWVRENTAPSERIMAPWGGVIYLRTGRRTSIANPEEPAFAPSALAVPERFYASRLLADTVDVVIIWDGAPGRSAGTLREMGARCPQLLTELRASPAAIVPADRAASAGQRPADVHFYRVRRDVPCLERFARGEAAASPAENKNAP